MLLLGKLGWDVSGVTAFDFVDHLMERIDLSPSVSNQSSSGSVKDAAAVLRGHALTYVSLCCTGTVISFSLSLLWLCVSREGGGCAFNQSPALRLANERRSGRWSRPSSCFISPLYYYNRGRERERGKKSDALNASWWNTRTNSPPHIPPLHGQMFIHGAIRCLCCCPIQSSSGMFPPLNPRVAPLIRTRIYRFRVCVSGLWILMDAERSDSIFQTKSVLTWQIENSNEEDDEVVEGNVDGRASGGSGESRAGHVVRNEIVMKEEEGDWKQSRGKLEVREQRHLLSAKRRRRLWSFSGGAGQWREGPSSGGNATLALRRRFFFFLSSRGHKSPVLLLTRKLCFTCLFVLWPSFSFFGLAPKTTCIPAN